jgi:calcineurin-like phosphoesterase
MCGDYDSVIGMNKEAATGRFIGHGNRRLSVALGAVTICGLMVEADDAGKAKIIQPLRRGGKLTLA